MTSTPAKTVHMAVYDTFADWEVGFATAHINNGAWQRDPGSHRVVTVGESRDPVTSMGGMRVTPDMTLDELSPADSAMLVLPGADSWLAGGNKAFAAKARELLGWEPKVGLAEGLRLTIEKSGVERLVGSTG